MQLATQITPTAVCNTGRASSRKQVLSVIARKAADVCSLSYDTIFTALLERERLGSTGVGKGVAIPHARFSGISKPVSVFVRLPEPVEFHAVDNQPVDLYFALLVPQQADKNAHLHHMALIARLMRNDALCAAIRSAPDGHAINALLADKVET